MDTLEVWGSSLHVRRSAKRCALLACLPLLFMALVPSADLHLVMKQARNIIRVAITVAGIPV